MERCPLCRAMLHGADTCRRCRAELGTVQQMARESQALVGAAIHHLMRDDAATAMGLLRRALVLHATPEAQSLWQLMVSRAERVEFHESNASLPASG